MASGAARGWRFPRRSTTAGQAKHPVPPGRTPRTTEADKDAERRAQLRRQQRQRRIAIGCLVVGAIMLVTHWFRHLDLYALSMDPALQDLTIGYGSGALLIMIGLYKLP